MSNVDDFRRRVDGLRWLTQGDIERAVPAADGAIPTGTELTNGGTRHPGRPDSEGQLGVFRSPYTRDTYLVDVAEKDRYGQLGWVSLPDSDPRYGEALAAVTGGPPAPDADAQPEPKRSSSFRP